MVIVCVEPSISALPPSDASGGPDPGKGRDVLPELRREPGRAGLAAVPGGVDDDVGRERFVDPLRGGRLERCAEHGEERDNAHADHERRRGRGRPPRVADGVLAGEFAGEATGPRRWVVRAPGRRGGPRPGRARPRRREQATAPSRPDPPAGRRPAAAGENGGRSRRPERREHGHVPVVGSVSIQPRKQWLSRHRLTCRGGTVGSSVACRAGPGGRTTGIADRLRIAIDGQGAFRRFRDVLQRWESVEDNWYRFSDERRRARARAWLASTGYRPTHRQQSAPTT